MIYFFYMYNCYWILYMFWGYGIGFRWRKERLRRKSLWRRGRRLKIRTNRRGLLVLSSSSCTGFFMFFVFFTCIPYRVRILTLFRLYNSGRISGRHTRRSTRTTNLSPPWVVIFLLLDPNFRFIFSDINRFPIVITYTGRQGRWWEVEIPHWWCRHP